MKICKRVILGLFFLVACVSQDLLAQGQDKTVLFLGRVVTATKAEDLPLAYVYNPKAGRGALSDNFGMVEMYVFPGDSLVFTYVGYQKKYYIIPKNTDQVHRAIISLSEESKILSEVKVFPHSSEEEFKQAFLNMRLRDEKQRGILANNLEQSKLNVFALQAGMGASSNFRNFSDQMVSAQANKTFYASPILSLTNPFAWINFIQSIKNGDLKKKEWKKAYEFLPKENISRQQFLRETNTNK
ncbi:carboxypeptidase-like regulatory domain-containing protein [Aquirufa aurantiipilula]|uniref:Carboxypeptidase-like regulatory domain-containing protein n=1 Tax=Aquirufa aurantiipilula TaxID=2696561 RepID=A0ABT6BGI5_9BACT|nr:carboxypeptidase-like regulatory domain-containing protein [Aquirufa aurantiipilula]MBZ1327076.1 carboxypeptidase-like regulatory domain-containing protein [Aquirufa aurantiipilula]MDF5689358.1 carboxypeptidase-like regulatory domain-containing protein [Aquirufa aurantiipilula]